MNKSGLIKKLRERVDVSQGMAEKSVDTFFRGIVSALAEGRRVEIRGFGSFGINDYKAYIGRNPRTGEHIRVAPKRLPVFKAGKLLREKVNQID